MEKNVIVLDTFGNEVGRTYEKRAKGLVKSGRAARVDEKTIRMVQILNTDNLNMKGTFYMNTILFNARDWKCTANADRTFITGTDGELGEVITLGNWKKDEKGVITSKVIKLEDSESRFVFWLNGGENADKDEICQLQIIPTDYENDAVSEEEEEFKLTYKLNRNFIKPLKKYKGWNLYCIPFNAEGKSFVVLKFVSQGAFTTVKAAKAPEEYADLKNVTDRYEQYRPLRHNIVFEDGWDNDEEYATRFLKDIWGDGGENCWNEGPAIDQDTLDAWAKSLGDFARKVSDSAKDLGTKAYEAGKEYAPQAKETGKKVGKKAVELGKEGASFVKKETEKIMASDAVKKFSAKLSELFASAPKASDDASEECSEECTDCAEEKAECAEAPELISESAQGAAASDTSESSDTSDSAE
ncbi:MAG: hypothetical protein K6F92_01995 [Lachnospiraceae bacterium]|nr:hypothetical protein [Lachnospiraceae bacterium]